jgi:hypothetical protein
MMNPGIYSLGDQVITTPVTGLVLAPVVDLDGLTAITLQVRFAPVSGGTTCKAWVQTSLDQGQTWADIFYAAFTTTAGIKIVNLSGLTPRTTVLTPADATLADDTVVDGVLGDRLRLKITSTGIFGSVGGCCVVDHHANELMRDKSSVRSRPACPPHGATLRIRRRP